MSATVTPLTALPWRIVFFGFDLGPKRVVEAVDHIEHRRGHGDLDNLGVAIQALHGVPQHLVAFSGVECHRFGPRDGGLLALIEQWTMAPGISLHRFELRLADAERLPVDRSMC